VQKLVFLISSDSKASQIVSDLLVELGCRVHAFSNAEDALGLGKRILPFAVFCDLRLPGRDGREVLSAFRELDDSIGCILVLDQEDTKQAEIPKVITTILSKPLTQEDLSHALATVEEEQPVADDASEPEVEKASIEREIEWKCEFKRRTVPVKIQFQGLAKAAFQVQMFCLEASNCQAANTEQCSLKEVVAQFIDHE